LIDPLQPAFLVVTSGQIASFRVPEDLTLRQVVLETWGDGASSPAGVPFLSIVSTDPDLLPGDAVEGAGFQLQFQTTFPDRSMEVSRSVLQNLVFPIVKGTVLYWNSTAIKFQFQLFFS